MADLGADPCALTARYFDGEADGDGDDERALAHLATCQRCQLELGDLIGIDVALDRTGVVAPAAADVPASVEVPAPAPAPVDQLARRRRRWLIPAVAAAALAAAALAVVVSRDRGEPPVAPVALALADQRGVEVRFSAAAFDRHRPYAVSRGAAGRESFSLTALAALERRGERPTLAAAQAARGEVDQARALLEASPPSPARDADLAAVAILAGRPEDALIAAERALAAEPTSTVARWNRGLALRDLGFGAIAADELDRIAASAEPGWATEARARAAALREPLRDRAAAYDRFTLAAHAMIDRAGPPLSADDVRERPGYARLYYFDALRGSASAAEVRALASLASALDAAAGTHSATEALTATADADFNFRAPLARGYRALALGRSSPSATKDLLARALAAGPALRDLRIGALVLAHDTAAHLDELVAYAAATADPWFTLLAAHERATSQLAAGASDRAEVILRDALLGCDARAWGLRCGRLAMDLANLYGRQSRYADAALDAERAARMYGAVGAVPLEDYALSYLAEVQRGRGRLALATAAFQELLARLPEDDCATRRFARAGLALVGVYRGDAQVAGDPGPADACAVVPSGLELVAVVDLARLTATVGDRTRARAWIDRTRQAAAPGPAGDAPRAIADVATAVLDLATDPGATRRLHDRLPAIATASEEDAAVANWGYGALVERDAAGSDWAAAAAAAGREVGLATVPSCTLIASIDRAHGVAIAIDQTGAAVGARSTARSPEAWEGPALVPPAIRGVLGACRSVGVLARPPLHGRADLLPPSMPWAFIGDRPTPPPRSNPATRAVIVGDARPPAGLGLPALAPLHAPADATVLRGSAATPAQVLDALADASYAELHVHGQLDPTVADGAFLALTPGADDRWALTAADVRTRHFAAAPVVVLAACRAASVAPFLHARWSLPDAFLAAGARAVIAPTVEVPDDAAAAFFDDLRAHLAAGESPAAATAAVRTAALGRGQTWAAGVVVFE